MHCTSVSIQGDWGDKVTASTQRRFWLDFHTGSQSIREEIRFESGEFESSNVLCELKSDRRLYIKSEKHGVECDIFWHEEECVDISALDHKKGVGYSQCFDVAHPSLGLVVASGGHLGGLRMHIWGNKTVLRRFKDHEGVTNAVKFFPNGRVLLTGGADKTVQIYAIEDKSGKAAGICRGHLADITDLETIGVGRNVISTSVDGTMCLWDCGTQQLIHQWGELSILNPIIGCAKLFSHEFPVPDILPPLHNRESETDGHIMACANADGRVLGFDLRARSVAFEFEGCGGESLTAIAGKQNLIGTGSENGIISLWDIRNTSEEVFSISRGTGQIEDAVFDSNSFLWAGDSGGSCCAHDMNGSVRQCITNIELGGISKMRLHQDLLFIASKDYRMRTFKLDQNRMSSEI